LKSRSPATTNPLSLLVEILDWLLAPLIILWPLSVVATFWIANTISYVPYDRALADSVNALARYVSFNETSAQTALPAAASSFLRTDELDTIYFQVRGTRGEVLERIGIQRARMLVFAIASHQDEKRGVAVARHLNKKIHIVARTRYVSDIEELYALGANEVVPEEFETSLEIFARVLRRYGVTESRICQMHTKAVLQLRGKLADQKD